MRLLVTGAAGSGTSTLGRALADEFRCAFFEADDFYWWPSNPPYSQKRSSTERLNLARETIALHGSWVMSGSVMGWGSEIEDEFTAVVFVLTDTATRLERLRQRETERHGSASQDFLNWAAQYDQGTATGRSLARHEAWLSSRKCPIIRSQGAAAVEHQVRHVIAILAGCAVAEQAAAPDGSASASLRQPRR